MNPFENKSKKRNGYYGLKELSLKSYDKGDTDPYSKTRIILMNGTEFESVWFYHQFARHCEDNDLKRDLAEIRRVEQQQQKRIGSLKPVNESILETTLSYEQLAVDLTAILAKREKNANVKKQLDFALLEDFDHLYRFSDLLEMEEGQNFKNLIGTYTEVMPGRPTIAEHRNPIDDVRYSVDFKTAEPLTKLAVGTIIAAEQQTMNFYMNVAGFYHSERGRKLFSEIAMIEEQHVSGYESLKDPNESWLACMINHEYNECYLYYSCLEDETDPYLKRVWEEHFNDELKHLKRAAELFYKYEKRDYREVIPAPDFPDLLKFTENKDYVRGVLKSVKLTAQREKYIKVSALEEKNSFKDFQKNFIKSPKDAASHTVIEDYIEKHGEDLRYQISPHPERELRNRKEDNVFIGRPL